jgi:hypothetical protein
MPRSFGFLSTYPPTKCGLASYSYSLVQTLAKPAASGAGSDRLIHRHHVDSRKVHVIRPTREVVTEPGLARRMARQYRSPTTSVSPNRALVSR